MAAAGYEMVRYADDFVILCRTAEEAQQALAVVQRWTAAAGLRLHPEKTHIVDCTSPVALTSWAITSTGRSRWPRKKSLRKLKDTVRQKTRRTNGHSLAVIIADVNRTLVGWFGYFKHSHRTVPRSGRMDPHAAAQHSAQAAATTRGCGRGRDHQRWPNAFFTDRGCFPWRLPMLLRVSPRRGDSSTGEPDAGNPPVRFGGRGERTQSPLPTPIRSADWLDREQRVFAHSARDRADPRSCHRAKRAAPPAGTARRRDSQGFASCRRVVVSFPGRRPGRAAGAVDTMAA